ncbi:MAG: hypothetical protein ACRDB0_08060 [Paraclostridium sp.]
MTKEEFIRAFERNNDFIKAEKRRKKIWDIKSKEYEIDNLKSNMVSKAIKKQIKSSVGVD